jgi:hypothetical protein
VGPHIAAHAVGGSAAPELSFASEQVGVGHRGAHLHTTAPVRPRGFVRAGRGGWRGVAALTLWYGRCGACSTALGGRWVVEGGVDISGVRRMEWGSPYMCPTCAYDNMASATKCQQCGLQLLAFEVPALGPTLALPDTVRLGHNRLRSMAGLPMAVAPFLFGYRPDLLRVLDLSSNQLESLDAGTAAAVRMLPPAPALY